MWQHMELTDTNVPCGLSIFNLIATATELLYCLIIELFYIQTPFFGGHSEEAPPVSIPNTEVKLFCADGTAWATVWESRSPPNSL